MAKKSTKTRRARRPSAKTRKKKTKSSGVRLRRRVSAEDYVREHAQQARASSCKVCCHPNVATLLQEICEEMDRQQVKITGVQLLRDMKNLFDGFACSPERFRRHLRDCLGRQLS